MQIHIDASRSIDSIQKTGVEKVSDELLKQFDKQNTNCIFYTPQKISWLPSDKQKVLSWPFKFLWTHWCLGWKILINPPTIFFSPVHTLPISSLFNFKTKFYKIIHDIAFKKNPHLYSWTERLFLELDLKLAVIKCAKVFVPSQQIKQDLINNTSLAENKIVVIPHGYTSVTDKPYTVRKKQILCLGRIEAKKNTINLIKAFKLLNHKFPDYELILAGKIDEKYFKKITDLAEYQKIKNKIKFLGYISDKKKYQLLAESACLAYVSFEEGFGFPILEAFDFDLPVVCSDIPVMHETGDSACLYSNPNSPQNIAENIEKIIADKTLCQQLTTAGQTRLKLFDWEKVGERYLSFIVK